MLTHGQLVFARCNRQLACPRHRESSVRRRDPSLPKLTRLLKNDSPSRQR
jgi:hypothetical protein